MIKSYDTLSSAAPGGQRDLSAGLSRFLETGEALTSAEVVASNPTAAVITEDTGVGQNVNFHVHAAVPDFGETVTLYIAFVGDQGTSDTAEVELPISKYVQ